MVDLLTAPFTFMSVQSMSSPRLTTALMACEQALQPSFQPEDFIVACQKMGNVLQGMGRFDDATLWHTQAIAPQPDFAQIYAGVGRVYMLQSQWQEAAEAYQNVLSHDPNYAEAYWKLAAIALHQGKRQQAMYYWYHALALDPTKSTVEGHLKLGHGFLKLGQADYAMACYRRAIRLDRQQPDGYRALAQVLTNQKRWDEAIATYRQATEQLVQAGWAFYQWGVLQQQQGQVDEALDIFLHGIAHEPTFPWSHHDAIEILLAQQRWHEAIAQCRDALDIHPFPWAFSQLGRALAAVGNREEAIACHQTASDLRGWSHCKQHNYQFTQDWFTHNIPIWQPLLEQWVNAPNICALEVGSFQGMSACWLLDTVLTHPTARLTCIDPGVQPEFHTNLAKTGVAQKVTLRPGDSHQLLPTLPPDCFDLIYIDGCHLSAHVHKDGVLAWPLLKPGGVMIFDDYLWTDPQHPGQDPQHGIDQFLDTVRPHSQILHHGYQIILKKSVPTPC